MKFTTGYVYDEHYLRHDPGTWHPERPDRVRAIHRLGNPAAAGGDLTVTLHVYSLPHDRCLSFDAERRTATVRDLAYDPEPA